MSFVVRVDILKPELVLLATTRKRVPRATRGSDLAQEGTLIIQARVVTRPIIIQIMETNTSKPWDTSWYNKYDLVFAKKNLIIGLVVIIKIFPVSSATPRIWTYVRVIYVFSQT